MVQQQPARSAALDNLFHALADPTRRAMLQSLAGGQRNIGELAAPHRMSFAAASKHVRVLEAAGLVKRKIEGRAHLCRIDPSILRMAEKWIGDRRAAWEHHLDRLGEFLAEQEAETRRAEPKRRKP
jgi:DNA-binding transcriptional ArsR family regulator